MSEVEKPFYNAFDLNLPHTKTKYSPIVGSPNPELDNYNCSPSEEEDEPGLDEVTSLLTESQNYTLLHLISSESPSPRSARGMTDPDMIDNTACVAIPQIPRRGLRPMTKRYSQNGPQPPHSAVIGLGGEAGPSSSSSPFHSANEDFGLDSELSMSRDRLPLIRGPSKQGTFHQFLSSIRIGKRAGSAEAPPQATTKPRRSSKDRAIPDEEEVVLSRGGQGSPCSIGILLASISCIFFATSALIVKVSTLHPMELLCVRGLLQGLFVLPIIISTKSNILGPPKSRSLLFARAVLGSVSLIMAFSAIHLIPLADAATVIFTSPVFVSIFACLCLGEICAAFDVCMILLTLLGVLLVSKPSFGFLTTGSWGGLVGTCCGLLAAMLTALAFIVLRQLKHVHYSVTVFWFSMVLASFGAVLTVALDGFTPPNSWLTALQCVGIGICGFLGQILLTKALQIENAGPVAVARTLDIVLSFLFQITFLHDTPDLYSYLGSMLVVACVLLTAFSRWFKEVQAKRLEKTTAGSVRSQGHDTGVS